MSEFTPNRRTVIRTAAWSAPVVAVATAAPAFATSPPDPVVEYQTVTPTFTFYPTLDGVNPLLNLPITVDVEATIPSVIPAGLTADPTTTVSTVTIPGSLVDLILTGALGNPETVSGTSVSTANLSGAYTGESITNLTIPETPWPAPGNPLVTVATGTGASNLPIPVDTEPGTVFITLAPPASTLIGTNADGVETTYVSTLLPGPIDDYTLGTFEIV